MHIKEHMNTKGPRTNPANMEPAVFDAESCDKETEELPDRS